MKNKKQERSLLRFPTLPQSEVPHSRSGKHHDIVARILVDVQRLTNGNALRIPLTEIGDTKEKVRSALNRASRKRQMVLATATDERFLYVWRKHEDDAQAAD